MRQTAAQPTRPADAFEGARSGRRTGRRAPPLVIEGEAVLISRRSAGVPLQGAWTEPADQARTDEAAAWFAGEAARAAATAAAAAPARPAPSDLIFSAFREAGRQGSASRVAAGASRTVLPLAGGIAAGVFAMAAVAFAAMPGGRGEAAGADAAAVTRGGVTLSEVVARMAPRNDGEVLSVEGLIRNATASAAAVPPLKLSLTQADGVVRARPVVPLARSLGPGEVLRFQTMVAVPKGSAAGGDVDLAFAEPVS